MSRARTKLLCTTLLVSGLAVGMAPFAPSLFAPAAHAQQRVEVRQEFRVALEPHGRFERHERFGEVWRPNRISRDWRPYTVGRWVYTDDWGWYWNSDQTEADWGWVAFHYGRWVDDRQMGWVWVPGEEWGPAWVNWRRGEGQAVARGGRGSGRGGASADVRYIGWSPLPPEDVIVEYRDNPDVWTFVRARDIVSPRISTVIIRERRPEILQQTVVVNRTVVVRERGVIVNPGISPSYVAAFVGRPIVTYDVRPRVIAGTTRVNNAIEVRVDDLRDRRRFQEQRPVIRETRTRIEPMRDIPAPQELRANEQGRLGDRPPRAAAEGGPDQRQDRTTGDQRAPGAQPGVRPGQAPGEQPSTTTQQQQRDLAPGQRGATPGQAGTAPGRAGDTPGQAGTAPGTRREPRLVRNARLRVRLARRPDAIARRRIARRTTARRPPEPTPARRRPPLLPARMLPAVRAQRPAGRRKRPVRPARRQDGTVRRPASRAQSLPARRVPRRAAPAKRPARRGQRPDASRSAVSRSAARSRATNAPPSRARPRNAMSAPSLSRGRSALRSEPANRAGVANRRARRPAAAATAIAARSSVSSRSPILPSASVNASRNSAAPG